MERAVLIQPASHADVAVAARIHAVQMRAYAQEAQLLGAVYFPPLKRTVEDIRTSSESFIAAFRDGALVGALSYWPDDEGFGTNIASLVVDPPFQRRGIGRLLMEHFLAVHPGKSTVQTGIKNVPALTLYAQCGFTEHRRWFVGREPLELIKLRRGREDKSLMSTEPLVAGAPARTSGRGG
jgi:GNAT superfamily N-acetyltransferase